MTITDFTLSDVREHRKYTNLVPRVHGNGFIQLDIGPGQRLHIWGHPGIPRQTVNTAIHDHMFSFQSRVIRGRLFNVRYDVVSGEIYRATHDVYCPAPRNGEDTILESVNIKVRLCQPSIDMVSLGARYTMPARHFHESVTDRPSASIMEKLGDIVATPPNGASVIAFESIRRARVLVPIGHKPDNDFNRHAHDEAHLWQIIEEVIGA